MKYFVKHKRDYDGARIGSPLSLLMITGWGIFGHTTLNADISYNNEI